ncbi:transposase [Patescibacteria group bacterium]|nr:transposase [Patescibacteria group bacterium]
MPCKPKLSLKEQAVENQYLEAIFRYLYPNLKTCPKCRKKTKFHKVRKLKIYTCQRCGHSISPLSNTIFHKSSTPLAKWLKAFDLYSKTNGKITIHALKKELGVTQKTAWRVKHKIQKLLSDKDDPLYDFLKGRVI